jgi:predicted TIM-barrel fold metal-dependent hydrolase
MRTDVHQHLWPHPLVDALRARRSPPYLEADGDAPVLHMTHEPAGVVDLTRHRLDSRLAALDAAGIERAVISLSTPLGIEALPEAESLELIGAYHDGLADLIDGSDGRLAGWAAAPLACPDAGARTVESALDRGFVGASLPSEALAGPEAIERVAPLLDMLERRRAAVFVHPGPAPETQPYALDQGMPIWWPNLGVYPGLSIRAFFGWRTLGASRWPDLRICFAIMAGGAPFLEERWRAFSGETRAIDRNLYMDTASCGRLALECGLATYGVEQIVLGTDIPVISPLPLERALTDLGAAVEDAVARTNPLRLFDEMERP